MDGTAEPGAALSRYHGLALLAGALLAGVLLTVTSSRPATHFDELALGLETHSLYATVDGLPIHCGDLSDAGDCFEGHRRRGARPVVLWLGNSQLHAVNQLKPGDETAPLILHKALVSRGLDVLAFSQPNANLQEHLILFAYLSSRLPIRVLLLSLVFDDLRETGVRADVALALEDPSVVPLVERSEIGRSIVRDNQQVAGGDIAALRETVQELSEKAINEWLEAHSELWAARPQARGILVSNALRVRNSIFGIDASSKRKMIAGRLEQNLAAAEALLAEAQRQQVPVIAYIVPLRDDVETPYIQSEYAAFKQDAEQLVTQAGGTFADLSELVPGHQWGHADATGLDGEAEIDFMHFQAGGHALLARAVLELLPPTHGDAR